MSACPACGSERAEYYGRKGMWWRFGILPMRAECPHVYHAAARINQMLLRSVRPGETGLS